MQPGFRRDGGVGVRSPHHPVAVVVVIKYQVEVLLHDEAISTACGAESLVLPKGRTCSQRLCLLGNAFLFRFRVPDLLAMRGNYDVAIIPHRQNGVGVAKVRTGSPYRPVVRLKQHNQVTVVLHDNFTITQSAGSTAPQRVSALMHVVKYEVAIALVDENEPPIRRSELLILVEEAPGLQFASQFWSLSTLL